MRTTTAILTTLALGASAHGQSLYERPAPRALDVEGREMEAEVSAEMIPLAAVSLYRVEPPEPRAFLPNDLVTIIISERARTDRIAELETEKEYELDGTVQSSIDLLKLLELRLEQGRDQDDDLPTVTASLEREYAGEGEYRRDDTVTARVTARVVEVKPNGNLLLEARTSVRTDEEQQTILVSGTARSEDVTNQNTVQSNQLYDLTVDIQNTGQVKDGASKGVITRVLDTLFNF
jgi:flagellar L-ring protein FlgH